MSAEEFESWQENLRSAKNVSNLKKISNKQKKIIRKVNISL